MLLIVKMVPLNEFNVIHCSISSRCCCVSATGTASPQKGKCYPYGICGCWSPTDWVDDWLWRCHNWSYGTGVMEKLMGSLMRIKTVFKKDHRSTSWPSLAAMQLIADITMYPDHRHLTTRFCSGHYMNTCRWAPFTQ